MADVLRLSCPSSSPLLLTFSSSPNSANRLGFSFKQNVDGSKICLVPEFAGFFPNSRKGSSSFKIRAIVTNNDEPKWWERTAVSNMIDIHSTEEFLNALREAGEKLVIVDFYGTWCGSCRALFPKLCRTAQEHPDIIFLKVNFDANKLMCKRLNVKVLPYFHFYRGSDGQLESFSCSLAKFQKIKDAIEIHNTARCSIGPPRGVGDLTLLDGVSATKDKPAEASNSR